METNFLTHIVEQKRSKLEKKKRECPLLPEQVVRAAAMKPSNQRPFFLSLDRSDRLNFIAEIKRASPSRGLLRAHVDPAELALPTSLTVLRLSLCSPKKTIFLGLWKI